MPHVARPNEHSSAGGYHNDAAAPRQRTRGPFLVTGPIAAQVPGSSAATVQGFEGVIVTGQKRSENIQTVPVRQQRAGCPAG